MYKIEFVEIYKVLKTYYLIIVNKIKLNKCSNWIKWKYQNMVNMQNNKKFSKIYIMKKNYRLINNYY